MKKYIGIWLDHKKAYIVTLIKEELASEEDREIIELVHSNVDRKVKLSGGSRTRKTPYGPQNVAVDGKKEFQIRRQLKNFYKSIINKVKDAVRIYIFGPGEAKIELKKEIEKSIELASRIKAVETADKMTAKQITARVREVFASYLE
ncbi:MAG: hypothetical protein JSW26_29590 [Desulfobacterales bacterium]|nr:MAG: hypothetical protein JSW26_29590 [Desulfobacterales bacterium]